MARAVKQQFSRSALLDLMDDAINEHGSVIIRRPGRKDLVVMPIERLRDFDTTEYLLASPKNRRRLLEALRDAKAGRGRPMSVADLRKSVGLNG
jgi:antitoxin YefM